MSQKAIAAKYGISKCTFSIIVAIEEKHGTEGILNSPKVTGKFQIDLVKWKQQNLTSITENHDHFYFK